MAKNLKFGKLNIGARERRNKNYNELQDLVIQCEKNIFSMTYIDKFLFWPIRKMYNFLFKFNYIAQTFNKQNIT